MIVVAQHLIPSPEGLGGLGVMVVNVVLLLVITNIVVILLNKYVLKKNSFGLVFITLFVLCLSSSVQKTYSSINAKQYRAEMVERTLSVDQVKIEVLSCSSGKIKKGAYDFTCELQLSNLPSDIDKTKATYELYLGSDEYFRYTQKELDKQFSSSALDKKGIVEVTNHRLGSNNFSVSKFVLENIVIGSFSTIIPENISQDTLYVTEINIYDGYDKYLSNARKDFLF